MAFRKDLAIPSGFEPTIGWHVSEPGRVLRKFSKEGLDLAGGAKGTERWGSLGADQGN